MAVSIIEENRAWGGFALSRSGARTRTKPPCSDGAVLYYSLERYTVGILRDLRKQGRLLACLLAPLARRSHQIPAERRTGVVFGRPPGSCAAPGHSIPLDERPVRLTLFFSYIKGPLFSLLGDLRLRSSHRLSAAGEALKDRHPAEREKERRRVGCERPGWSSTASSCRRTLRCASRFDPRGFATAAEPSERA